MQELITITLIFLLAGYVKGVIGMGLPTIAMATLGLLLAPVQAAALLVIPSLVTNVWQFAAGSAKMATLKRLWPMLLFVCLGTWWGIGLLTASDSAWPNVWLGGVLALYALVALFHPKFSMPVRHEKWLSPIVGFLTGILTGATGVFVIPAVPFLSSMNLSKDELIQALGLSFTVSTIALALGLGFHAKYSQSDLLISVAAVLPAMLGMWVGQKTRDSLDPMTFRKCFFGALFVLGAYMAIRSGYGLVLR
jgi:uncharacterized membrane protein YfcA